MDIPVVDMSDNETGCCPRFHPEEWHKKVVRIHDQMFARAVSKSLFYMPINLNKVMTASMDKISKADAMPKSNYLILSKDLSSWRCEHHFMVEKPVEGLEMTNLNGEYYLMTFDGPYKMIPKWIESFKHHVKDEGYHLKEIYYFFTTCPECAKHYGHNYVVFFGKI
ncbi:MAG: hypothetical protein JXR88_11390 [Clostridia bacterium]|nr:hypothetical protein [Clostridia bacterium]